MAKTIAKRTLVGYTDWQTNILYLENLSQKLKNSLDETAQEITEGFGKMKFDVVIGNPPYQEEAIGDSTQAPPIYHKFMDEAYKLADKVSFITPARFLFNAGATGKSWNEKMLNDEHLKVIYFNQDSSKVFPNTDIKGGVAVTYRDRSKNFGAIGTFTSFTEIDSILQKVEIKFDESLETIFYQQTKVNQQIDDKFPTERRIRPNWFDKFPNVFLREADVINSIKIIGLEKGNKRTERYVSESIIYSS